MKSEGVAPLFLKEKTVPEAHTHTPFILSKSYFEVRMIAEREKCLLVPQSLPIGNFALQLN